jgi:hypothetical protein
MGFEGVQILLLVEHVSDAVNVNEIVIQQLPERCDIIRAGGRAAATVQRPDGLESSQIQNNYCKGERVPVFRLAGAPGRC